MRKGLACFFFAVLVAGAAQTTKEIFDRAVQALAAEDYQTAERDFQTVLRQEPRNVGALGNLGVIYSRTGRADQAITMYQRALQSSPDDEALLLNLGLVYLRQENHARAMPLFARVVAIDPQHKQARQLLAVCQAYVGQLEPAIQELEALRKGAPQDENILFLLGFAYLRHHEPEKAKAIFAQMFQDAGPVRSEFLAGKAAYEAALFSQAEESFRKVIQLDAAFPEVHLELGKVYISLRRTDDAVGELQRALKANPGDADASYFLGAVLVQAGRYAEGVPHLERAKTAKPDFWAPYFYLGKAKLKLEQAGEAAAQLQKAAALNSDDAMVYDTLARALEKCGREAEARRAMAKVRALRDAALQPKANDAGVAGAR
ncbi:MAG TPA: tetratricopeptide repeat protein [Bryobacteraceae bacterium]|nr:tetratricopeptide repeat protein [Bryobacteraceae bacterium]